MLVAQSRGLPRYLVQRILGEAARSAGSSQSRSLRTTPCTGQMVTSFGPRPASVAPHLISREAYRLSLDRRTDSPKPPAARRTHSKPQAGGGRDFTPRTSVKVKDAEANARVEAAPSLPADTHQGAEDALQVPPAPEHLEMETAQLPAHSPASGRCQGASSEYLMIMKEIHQLCRPLRQPETPSETIFTDIHVVLDRLRDSPDCDYETRFAAYRHLGRLLVPRKDLRRRAIFLLKRQSHEGFPIHPDVAFQIALACLTDPQSYALAFFFDHDKLKWLARQPKRDGEFITLLIKMYCLGRDDALALLAIYKQRYRARGEGESLSEWFILAQLYRNEGDLVAASRMLPSLQLAIKTRTSREDGKLSATEINALGNIYTTIMTSWVELYSEPSVQRTRGANPPTGKFPALLAQNFRQFLLGFGVEEVPISFLCAWLNAERVAGKLHPQHEVWQYVRYHGKDAAAAKVWLTILETCRSLGDTDLFELRTITSDMVHALPPELMSQQLLHALVNCILHSSESLRPFADDASPYRPVWPRAKLLDLALLYSILDLFGNSRHLKLNADRKTIDTVAWGLIKIWIENPITDQLFVTADQPLEAVQAVRRLVERRRENAVTVHRRTKGAVAPQPIYNEAWVMLSLAVFARRPSVQHLVAARAARAQAGVQLGEDEVENGRRICYLPAHMPEPSTLQALLDRQSKYENDPLRSDPTRWTAGVLAVRELYGVNGVIDESDQVRGQLQDVRRLTQPPEGASVLSVERYYAWMGRSFIGPLKSIVRSMLAMQEKALMQRQGQVLSENAVDKAVEYRIREVQRETGLSELAEAMGARIKAQLDKEPQRRVEERRRRRAQKNLRKPE